MTTQLTLDQYVPCKEKGGTSEEAARDAMNKRANLQRLVCVALRTFGPATADEIAQDARVDRLSIRPRLTELQLMGIVRKTGIRRKNASGKSASVWEII